MEGDVAVDRKLSYFADEGHKTIVDFNDFIFNEFLVLITSALVYLIYLIGS